MTATTDIAAGVSLAVSTVVFALRPDPKTELTTLWLPLVKRIRDPYGGRWALPGGLLEPDEDLDASAARTLKRTTSLAPKYLEQLYAFGAVNRSPGHDRVVSIVYWALVQSSEAARAKADDNVEWFAADELPELAFDHNAIVEYSLWRLRNKMEYSRIAHAFLGDTFTIAELRDVHEAVLQKPLDPANFRRQILFSKTIESTGRCVTGMSHRPPRLYRYNDAIQPTDQSPLTHNQEST